MIRLAAMIWLVLGLGVSLAGALNLTPHRILIGGDGPTRERHYFQDAEKRLGFHVDLKMSVTGSSDAAVFRFADSTTASMRLAKSTTPVDTPFSEEGMKVYAAAARALLPPDATNVQLVESVPDAISINGWKSVQLTFTYEFFGAAYQRKIAFLNFDATEQVVFDVSARAVDFANVYGRSYRVLNSLYELPPDSSVGPS